MRRLHILAFLVAVVLGASALAPFHFGAAFALFAIGIFVTLAMIIRGNAAGAQANNRGITLLSEGRLTEAIASFEVARRAIGALNPLPPYNIALANLWLWKLDEARNGLESASKAMLGRPLRQMAVPPLLLIAAVQNDAPRAAALEQEVKTLQLDRAPVVAIARAAFFARTGEWKRVLDTLTLERTRPLGGPARALADAIRSWATVEVGGARFGVDAVGVFGETGPTALAKWWPELARFIESAAR
jgi:hypothetical protein